MHLNWEFKLSTVDIDSVEQGHGYENTKEEYITIGKMRPWWLLREGLNLKKNLEFSRFSGWVGLKNTVNYFCVVLVAQYTGL